MTCYFVFQSVNPCFQGAFKIFSMVKYFKFSAAGISDDSEEMDVFPSDSYVFIPIMI